MRAALGFAATLLASSLAVEARAQDASPWIRDGHSAVRLLAGSRSGAVLLGGIAFQLQPGWKTYWRTPGDSGVPPRFDFSKSENIEAVTILWPAPTKFDDGAGGHSLGYHDQIVLPLRIVAKNADKPVTLRAAVNYAVCEKLCIPVEADPELAFTSVASTVVELLRGRPQNRHRFDIVGFREVKARRYAGIAGGAPICLPSRLELEGDAAEQHRAAARARQQPHRGMPVLLPG